MRLIAFCVLPTLKEVWIEQSPRQDGTGLEKEEAKNVVYMKVPEMIEAKTRVKNMDDDSEQRVRKEKERQTRLAETNRLTQGITRKMEDERQKDNDRKAQEVAAEEARGLASVSSSKSEISKKKKAHRGKRGGRKHREKSGNEALGSGEPLSADQAEDEDFEYDFIESEYSEGDLERNDDIMDGKTLEELYGTVRKMKGECWPECIRQEEKEGKLRKRGLCEQQ